MDAGNTPVCVLDTKDADPSTGYIDFGRYRHIIRRCFPAVGGIGILSARITAGSNCSLNGLICGNRRESDCRHNLRLFVGKRGDILL